MRRYKIATNLSAEQYMLMRETSQIATEAESSEEAAAIIVLASQVESLTSALIRLEARLSRSGSDCPALGPMEK